MKTNPNDPASPPNDSRLGLSKRELVAALENVLRYCVTVNGMPDRDKRTVEQQKAMDQARAALNKSKP